MAKDKPRIGLDALKALKTAGGTRSAPVRAPVPGRPAAPAPPAQASDTDAALFRREVGRVRPLKAEDYADLSRPRPAPLPRPKTPESTVPDTPRRPSRVDENDPAAVFRAALGDIAPIRDFNRADLSDQRRDTRLGSPPHTDAAPAPVDLNTLHDPAALFRAVAGDVAPLKGSNRADLERPLPAPHPRQREEDEREVLREALETPLTFEDRLDMGDEAAYLRSGLPRRVLTDLRRGRWVVQGELDLHGLTRDEARAALARFIADALLRGRRCLRVIHGKGHGSPGRIPVLKHLSRGWLAQREDILAFCQARPHDGGDGALLVLLRAGTPVRG